MTKNNIIIIADSNHQPPVKTIRGEDYMTKNNNFIEEVLEEFDEKLRNLIKENKLHEGTLSSFEYKIYELAKQFISQKLQQQREELKKEIVKQNKKDLKFIKEIRVITKSMLDDFIGDRCRITDIDNMLEDWEKDLIDKINNICK